MRKATCSILNYEIKMAEHKLIKLCLLIASLPVLVFIAALAYIVIRFFHHNQFDASDAVAIVYVSKKGQRIKQLFKFKK